MPKPQLTVFLDIVSPFAYMAFYVTKNSPIFAQCDVTYIPIFLGGVMKACGNTPPIQIKNKDKWIDIERKRWAKYCNIPMAETMPEGFPPLTLHVQRALCAIQLSAPQTLPAAFDALYHAMWVESQAAHKPEIFSKILASVLGEQKAKAAVEKGPSAEAKQLLSSNTDLAITEGAFGLPWFIATNEKGEKEGFWGFDHLGQVIEHLGLERKGDLRAML